jgi:hypothetical protein
MSKMIYGAVKNLAIPWRKDNPKPVAKDSITTPRKIESMSRNLHQS